MKKRLTSLLLIIALLLSSASTLLPPTVFAATSPGLGDAASFAVLAGTAITNVPTSTITGDVGLSPAAGTNYSGLTTAEVSGTIFAVDASGPAGSAGNNPTLVNQAKTDLVTAYNALATGANADANCEAGYTFGSGNVDLVGLSLSPGVYCADTFTLTGTLTLTGSGVWVFRSAATLITSGTANIVGGDACDVWWQVPSSATLGTTTSLKGNVLALTSITMNTGATLEGRALARNGAVSLDSNTINQSCTTPTPTPTAVSSSTSSNLTAAGVASSSCPELPSTVVAPNIVDAYRVDADSIFLSWGPYSGTDRFNISYGPTNGNWLYSTDVTGFSTTINALPANQPMWFQIAARNNCTIGSYGESRLVGGTSGSNTLIPRLPNTGVGPQTPNSWMQILAGAGLSLVAFSLSWRLYKYSFTANKFSSD